MKKNHIGLGVLLGCALAANAQQDGLTRVLQAVDSNNTALRALRASTDAISMANLTGLNPADPQVQFNYLGISPGISRMRRDFNVTQTIDFPTAYGHRRQIARSANEKAALEWASGRAEIRYEAAQAYINWVYTRQLADQLERRAGIADQLAEGYERAFQAGEVSVLERNKARINALNATKTAELNAVESAALHAELTRLNGGNALPPVPMGYPAHALPADFEAWLSETLPRNTELASLEKDIAVGQAQQRLSKALALPAITGGYMYEEDIDARFSGVTLGLSIPLWQQRNTVKRARLQTQAYEQLKVDAGTQFYNAQKRLYQRAQRLTVLRDELLELTQDTESERLLKRALDLGELSLLDYLVELTMYYEAIDRRLEAERDMHLALAELFKWTI